VGLLSNAAHDRLEQLREHRRRLDSLRLQLAAEREELRLLCADGYRLTPLEVERITQRFDWLWAQLVPLWLEYTKLWVTSPTREASS